MYIVDVVEINDETFVRIPEDIVDGFDLYDGDKLILEIKDQGRTILLRRIGDAIERNLTDLLDIRYNVL